MNVRAAFFLATVIALAPMTALAQSATPVANPVETACKADLASLCADAGDKRGAQMRCLGDNKDKLSADCGTAVTAMQEKRKAMRAACKDDSAKLCPDLRGGEMMSCMRTKTADLSKPCADALAAMPMPVARQ